MIIVRMKRPERVASVAAMTTAAGAVACGVCCVLPFAFPAVAAASAGGVLAWFGDIQSWATSLATVIVVSAWIAVGIQSHQARAKPSRATACIMVIATAALVLAAMWPRIEPSVIRTLTGR
jgi:cytochrome bd-type quinol oxidase subunit 2